MPTRILLTVLLSCSLLAGCQSARFAPSLPRVSEYGVERRQPTKAPQLPAKPADEPVLSAALPGLNLGNDDVEQNHTSPLVASKTLSDQSAPLTAVPDTTLERLLRPEPDLRADPLTTVLNVVGAAATVGGVGFTIAGANGDNSKLYPLVQILFGTALVAIGIPLLFFQGKNGRQRLRRERRDESAIPESTPAPGKGVANKPLQKVGLGIGIAAALILLLGILLGSLSFALASFIGLPLGVVGIVLFIAGS